MRIVTRQPRLDDILQELAEAESLISAMLSSDAEPGEESVWPIYASLERMAAIVKLRLGVEAPGRFRELTKVKEGERRDLLEKALPAASQARASFERMSLIEGLASLRDARDLCRSYLADLRRQRLRLARAARRSVTQGASSPSSPS